jgi:hypothetical protein
MQQPQTCAPLHVSEINNHPVRFFLSPIQDGLPDFPWCCFQDLCAAFGLAEKLKDLSGERLSKISSEAMSIATHDGILTVIPHPDAQGFVLSMIRLLGIDAQQDYTNAGVDAFAKQLGEMTDKQVMSYSQAATERWKSKVTE